MLITPLAVAIIALAGYWVAGGWILRVGGALLMLIGVLAL